MNNNHLTYFKVENFKKFDSLEVFDIGQINLIVGDNNIGKTCLLESLLFDDYYLRWANNIHQTLYLRGIHLTGEIINSENFDYPINSYFNYILKDRKNSLKIEFIRNNLKETREIEYKGKISITAEELLRRKDKFNFKQIDHWLKFYKNGIFDELQLMYLDDISLEDFYFPFIKFNLSYSNDIDDYLHLLEKKREENDRKVNSFSYNHKQELIKTINKIFDFKITDFSTIHNEDYGMIGIATKSNQKYIPITQFGDGFNKIFRYIVEIMYIKERGESRIMIDEIDTGIHHSKLKNFWISLVKVCIELDIQLFATTHSKDCMDAIIQAASENIKMKKKIRLIKLKENKDGSVKSITYPYDEFEYLVESETEAR
jgi:AAA15 family ATPase/GTPase